MGAPQRSLAQRFHHYIYSYKGHFKKQHLTNWGRRFHAAQQVGQNRRAVAEDKAKRERRVLAQFEPGNTERLLRSHSVPVRSLFLQSRFSLSLSLSIHIHTLPLERNVSSFSGSRHKNMDHTIYY